MAAEPRAESPAPAPAAPPPPVPEKRAAPADVGDEERPGPKRRRAFVATLDGVPCAAAAAEEDGHRDGLSFSFQHSRGGFVPPETTPKFGSFNPPTAAEQQEAPDPKPAPPAGEGSPVVEEEGEDPASAQVVGDSQDGDSQPLDRKPAPPAGEDSPAVEEEGEDPASPHGVADRQDGDSQPVAAAGDQGEPETQDELGCADVHQQ